MKNRNDLSGNRNRDLPACKEVLQPTVGMISQLNLQMCFRKNTLRTVSLL